MIETSQTTTLLPGFVERNNSASAVSAFWKEQPFAEITILASGPVLKAVGLGVMVTFL